MTTGRINQVAITLRTWVRGLRAVPPGRSAGNVRSYTDTKSQTQNSDRQRRPKTAIYYTRPVIPLQERTPQDHQAS